jgi:iron complex outermembrane receptor protein
MPTVPPRRIAAALRAGVFVFAAAAAPGAVFGQTPGPSERSIALKRLSLDDLLNAEVTTASRQPEKLRETASAIQVITGEQIRRSGAASLPEALRLAPNLRVAQLNASAWVISARGFSGGFANKLLVMIDGRSVYTPLFGGVLWDVQNPPLEDIDRIEIVSGPGGSLWGANAVNGVINVITKSAADTKGAYASVSGGSFLHDSATVRYGGTAGTTAAWRVYAQRMDRDHTVTPTGADYADAWDMTQVGGRFEWTPSKTNGVVLDAAAYRGTYDAAPSDAATNGQHVLGRWTHTTSPSAALSLQAYVDRTWRDDPRSTISDELLTADVDLQQRLAVGARHQLVFGAGARLMHDETGHTTAFVALLPAERRLRLFNLFAQDEIMVVPARLAVTVGSKLEHNTYSGFEVQPTVRVAWTPSDRRTLWGAVSRAVRSPSRLDVDYHIPARIIEVGTLGVNGGPEFDSEKLVAYEVGYRIEPAATVALSVAAFFNHYDDLYSVEAVRGTMTYQIENGTLGDSSGVETEAAWQPVAWWRLRGGYTYFRKDLDNKPGHFYDPAALGNDPAHQLVLQSMMDFSRGWHLDVVHRVFSELPAPRVPTLATADVRVAWERNGWELSVVGQNLFKAHHSEFGFQDARRGAYANVAWRLPR